MSVHPLLLFVVAVLVGTALMRAAARRPAESEWIETLLGLLLCSGLILLGAGLKLFR